METKTKLRFVLGDQSWELDLGELTIDDCIALQNLVGRPWGELVLGIDRGDIEAMKLLLWAARRATGETGLPYASPEMSGIRMRDFAVAWSPAAATPAPAPVEPEAEPEQPTA
ncbi:MAG: hypothetical protein HOV94_41285 [Saccharothrix sp.]|nr:hypothetical protein [Saccharothrix sp.]